MVGYHTEFSLGKAIVLEQLSHRTTGTPPRNRLTSRLRSSLSAADSILLLSEYCLEVRVVVMDILEEKSRILSI